MERIQKTGASTKMEVEPSIDEREREELPLLRKFLEHLKAYEKIAESADAKRQAKKIADLPEPQNHSFSSEGH